MIIIEFKLIELIKTFQKVWLEEMSTNELFDVEAPENVDKNGQENDDDVESKKNEMSISKRELRRRLGDSSRTKQNETKAKRQRRLLLEKVKKRQKENEKQQRVQQNEIFRLKSLKRQVDESLNKADEERKKRAIEEEQRLKYATKRIGRLKYEEPELELKLSGELTSSLRTLKPEGNILTDRYKSLQKRNLIEPRVRAKYDLFCFFHFKKS